MNSQQAKSMMDDLARAGLSVTLTAGDKLLVSPAKAISDEQRGAIRAHRADLVEFLQRRAANDDLPILLPKSEPIDPDRWCWPHTDAMNSVEINTFMERVARFQQRGLASESAESVADRLVGRDRDPGDARRVCLECANHNWRGGCGASLDAGIESMGSARLPLDFTQTLQHCGGFVPYQPTAQAAATALSMEPA